jgi:NADPH2:quinone reductase
VTSLHSIPIKRFGPASTLAPETSTLSVAPGPGEVLVRARYTGVSFADIHMRLGLYPAAPPRPYVPGLELSGVIDAVGDGVTRLAVGDEVVAGSTKLGAYASHVVLPEATVFALPRGLDLREGAALPVNYVTCHVALFEMGRIRAGDRVLVEGASGGIGNIATQLALHAGATVTGLTTSAEKKPFIAASGATPYTEAEFYADESIRGFDFVLNATGGASVRRQLARLAQTGRMVCIGMSSAIPDGRRSLFHLVKAFLSSPRLSAMELRNSNRGIYGLNTLAIMRDEEWLARVTASFARVTEIGLRPHVDRVFDFRDVAAAHAYLESRRARGKVLLSWDVTSS